jgi:glyoxylase-like metal-dependent hydrolase (beta-lactamase superfamily II)
MRQIPIALAAAWLFTAALAVNAHEIKLPEDITDLSLTRISERIYVVHGIQELPDRNNEGFMSNTGIILTDSGAVIVDSGGSLQVGRLIVSKVKELTDQPIIAVFNTHVHGDHWLGNAALREAYPEVKIYAHQLAIDRLKNGEADRWIDIFMEMTEGSIEGTIAVLPDQNLTGGEVLKFGGTTFRTHHTGHAHTDSDIMIEVPRSRVLFTGDIVEHGRVASSDVPQDFNARGQIEAIEYTLKLPVDIYVPGHGISGGDEIPQSALLFLKILYDSVKRYYDQGLQDFEMRNQVAQDLSDFQDWYNFDQLGRLISIVYQQVELADFQ